MKNKSTLIIANWKSHKTKSEVEAWLEVYEKQFDNQEMSNYLTKKTVVICPPMPDLMLVFNKLLDWKKRKPFFLGVQDVSQFPAGKYTGAVSTLNLEGFEVRYAIVGHSERRRHFAETHQDVANKVIQCIEAGITPVVCVDDEYITQQATAIDQKYSSKCVVAYEELGAIGTGKSEPLDHVTTVFSQIKKSFGDVPVLYGGSVNEKNVSSYIEVCDGVLVGTASLDANIFSELVKMA